MRVSIDKRHGSLRGSFFGTGKSTDVDVRSLNLSRQRQRSHDEVGGISLIRSQCDFASGFQRLPANTQQPLKFRIEMVLECDLKSIGFPESCGSRDVGRRLNTHNLNRRRHFSAYFVSSTVNETPSTVNSASTRNGSPKSRPPQRCSDDGTVKLAVFGAGTLTSAAVSVPGNILSAVLSFVSTPSPRNLSCLI